MSIVLDMSPSPSPPLMSKNVIPLTVLHLNTARLLHIEISTPRHNITGLLVNNEDRPGQIPPLNTKYAFSTYHINISQFKLGDATLQDIAQQCKMSFPECAGGKRHTGHQCRRLLERVRLESVFQNSWSTTVTVLHLRADL
jgi:AraC-like DNA-binding protein